MESKIPRLFLILSERKITHKQLSDNIGFSTGNISDWKSGRSSPGIEALTKIAKYLDCSVDYLLGRTDDPTAHIKATPLNSKLVDLLSQLTPEQQESISAQIEGLLNAKK